MSEYPNIDPRFLFVNMGYNLRASELAAAIGLVQIGKLGDFVRRRRQAAAWLKEVFEPYNDLLRTQREQRPGASSWFGFPVVVTDDAGFTARELRKWFEAHGIETRPIIAGNIARQPGMKLFEHRTVGSLEHANRVMDNGFAIGCHQAVTKGMVDHVGGELYEFMTRYAA